MIYFTADLHLGHKNIIKYSKRPFKSLEMMNKILIENINATVKPNDTLFVLGDFSLTKKEESLYFLNLILCCKNLIIGNHDDLNNSIKSAFKICEYYYVLKYGGKHFVLFHYPLISWEGKEKGYIHLHGHVHNNAHDDIILPNKINVGVDVQNYMPISIEKIMGVDA